MKLLVPFTLVLALATALSSASTLQRAKRGAQWTPLQEAASSGNKAEVQELLQHDDIQIDAPDNKGRTPMHLAAQKGHSSVVAVLIQRGANINTHDDYLQTPLH